MKKLIGKGMFTKAYLLESGLVELHTNDPIKECLALWGFGDSYLWPSLEVVHKDYDQSVYSMEYYPKVASLKNNLEPKQYQLYKELRKLKPYLGYGKNSDYHYADHWRKQFNSLPTEFAEEKEALLEAIGAISNSGQDIQFEISPRNVAVKCGKLVLLDCFFLVSHLNQVKSKKVA